MAHAILEDFAMVRDSQAAESFQEDTTLLEHYCQPERSLREGEMRHAPESAALAAGDADAVLEDASNVGQESAGGGESLPDQSVVEDIGLAVGLVYQDAQPLATEQKLRRRDTERWELNPASAEDFQERSGHRNEHPTLRAVV